jgi:hypothetical protein
MKGRTVYYKAMTFLKVSAFMKMRPVFTIFV